MHITAKTGYIMIVHSSQASIHSLSVVWQHLLREEVAHRFPEDVVVLVEDWPNPNVHHVWGGDGGGAEGDILTVAPGRPNKTLIDDISTWILLGIPCCPVTVCCNNKTFFSLFYCHIISDVYYSPFQHVNPSGTIFQVISQSVNR